MKRGAIYIVVGIALIVLLSAVILFPQAPQKRFKIGALLPLTGGFSSYASLAKCAAELAIEDANKMFIDKGIRFELLVEDTQLDSGVALQKLQTLYAQGVRAVHAGLTSKEAQGEKQFADQNHVLLFSAWSTSSLLAQPNDWLYRIVGTDARQIRAIGALIQRLGIKNVAIVYRADPYGQGIYTELLKEAARRGFRVVSAASYDPAPNAFPQSAPAAVSRISSEVRGLDNLALLVVSFEDDGSVVLKAIGNDPVLSRARLIGTEGMAFSPVLQKEAGEVMARQGIIGTANWALPDVPEYQRFYSAYKARCGTEPITPAPQSYDIVMMLAQIMATIGTDDPDKVRATLEQWGKEGRYRGVTGVVLLDENGDRANPNFLYWSVVFKNGTPQYIYAGYYNYDKDTIEVTQEGSNVFK